MICYHLLLSQTPVLEQFLFCLFCVFEITSVYCIFCQNDHLSITSCWHLFPFYAGAETEEAAPVSQPVAAPAAAAAAPPPQPAADSLLGDLLMDVGPAQPVPAPSMAPTQQTGNYGFFIIKVYRTDFFFICLIESTQCPGNNSEKIFQ